MQGNNVFEDKLYYYVERYEKYGILGMTRFENDEIEGTFIINLKDLSVEKVSDKIYNGLYIFDDTGIYACDDKCNIVKLDFDGKMVGTLLRAR